MTSGHPASRGLRDECRTCHGRHQAAFMMSSPVLAELTLGFERTFALLDCPQRENVRQPSGPRPAECHWRRSIDVFGDCTNGRARDGRCEV